MNLPFHPFIIHFPLALTFTLPILILAFAYMIKINKMTAGAWLIIVGIQLVAVITGYVSLESGENEEHRVERVVQKQLIQIHEEAADVFVGSLVLVLVISIAAFFIKKEWQFPLQLGVVLLSLASCYLAYRTGHLGGELVYGHNAGSAYAQNQPAGLLPTPGINTSESPMPTEENESLKQDDNDYGNSDEEIENEEDALKQED